MLTVFTAALPDQAGWSKAIYDLSRELGSVGFTTSEVELLAANLNSAKMSSAELNRYKQTLLLSDTTKFSRPIQTNCGSHMGMRYNMYVHDPTVCVWISKNIYKTGWWERQISHKMLNLLKMKYLSRAGGKKKRIFLDIGANIGWYTFLWAAHGVDVISVEGMQYNVNVQQKTLHENPHLRRHVRSYHRILGSLTQGTACIKYLETKGYPNRGNGQVIPDDGLQSECHKMTAFSSLNAFDPESEHISR